MHNRSSSIREKSRGKKRDKELPALSDENDMVERYKPQCARVRDKDRSDHTLDSVKRLQRALTVRVN